MGAKIGTASFPKHDLHDAAIHGFYDGKVRYVRPVRKCSFLIRMLSSFRLEAGEQNREWYTGHALDAIPCPNPCRSPTLQINIKHLIDEVQC